MGLWCSMLRSFGAAHLAMRKHRLAGIATFHTHPGASASVGFSLYDDRQDPLLVENLLEIEPRTQFVSVVAGKDSQCATVLCESPSQPSAGAASCGRGSFVLPVACGSATAATTAACRHLRPRKNPDRIGGSRPAGTHDNSCRRRQRDGVAGLRASRSGRVQADSPDRPRHRAGHQPEPDSLCYR